MKSVQRHAPSSNVQRESSARVVWRDVLPIAGAIALGIGIPALVYLLARTLALLVLAATFAAALSPLADRLDRRMPRVLAVLLLYVTTLGLLGFLLSSVLPTRLQEMQEFIGRTPALFDQTQQWLSRWLPVHSVPLRDAILGVLNSFQATLVRLPFDVVGGLFDALVVLFLSAYLLLAGPRLKRFALSLISSSRRPRASRLMARVGRAMGGYVRGAIISGVFVGLLTWLALSLVGLDYASSLALAAGFGEFIPYIGPILAAVPATLVALGESPTQALTVALIYVGLQQLEGYVITPTVMSTQTDLPPALVIFALASGFSLGGLIGALAAVPVFAALRVIMLSATPMLRRWTREPMTK